MRTLLAIWAASLLRVGMRALGRAGTAWPGRVALRIHPGIIGAIAHPARVVVVTGTNGKTTVSNLLGEALAAEGLRVAGNRLGSNIDTGIAATLIEAVDWLGRSRADVAILEMDERFARKVLPGLDPDLLVCTNLTRDSIKRNAHPAYIAWIISSLLPERTELLLNADDLIASALGTEANPRRFFAVDRQPTDTTEPHGAALDVLICPVCDHRLAWDYWRFNHIGRARCPACGFRSPDAEYRAVSVDVAAGRLTLAFGDDERSATLINDNIVNVTNEVAVAAALDVLGVPRDRIVAAFETIRPPATRFSQEEVGGIRLVRQLTKGLVGVACSRAFQYVVSLPGRKSMVLTIDEATDHGVDVENTAWVYEADYEYLVDEQLEQIVVGGLRRHDQALRLVIAGVDPDRLALVESELAAADLVRIDEVDAVLNLHSVHNSLSTGNPVQARLRARLATRAATR